MRAPCVHRGGPEKAELVGNAMGSRRRLALALDTDEECLLATLRSALRGRTADQGVVADAPAQRGGATGDDADLCALPAHIQHGEDGAPYISAGLDFAVIPRERLH